MTGVSFPGDTEKLSGHILSNVLWGPAWGGARGPPVLPSNLTCFVKLLLLPGTISVFRGLWALVDVNWALAYTGASLRRIVPGASFGQ